MSWKTIQSKPWYLRWWVLLIFTVIAAAFLGWPRMKAGYRRWHSARLVRQAEESVAQGDFRRALLEARKALEAAPQSVPANRVMAKVLEGAGAAVAAVPWRSRLDSLVPGDPENLLAWAADAVKAGDPAAAERVLAMLQPEPKDDALYHATAARVAGAKRDRTAAERHWAAAARLAPQVDEYRLKLAGLRIGSKSAEVHAEAVKALKEISGRPGVGAEALRVLLADATNYRDWGMASDYAEAIVALPDSTFSDRLARLDTLRGMKSAAATSYLTELRDGALTVPEDLYLLLMWMNQHDLALLVSDWSHTLPPEIIGTPPVSVAMADAYVRSSEWPRLQDFLNERTWGESDYLRKAFLARALERLGEARQSALEWKDGVDAARGRGDARGRLERMVRLAIGWGWEQRAQEVMWSMAGSPACPRWMLDALWLIAMENADTAQLQKLASVLVQCDGKSVTLRNNSAFFSLLVRAENGDAQREAERLFSENPGHPAVTVTRALSLHQQGRTAEAAALTGSLPAGDLRQPQAALYHAIFLTAAGEGAKAEEFLQLAQGRKMFPEEKTMLERARQAVVKASAEQEIAEKAKAMRAARAAKDPETERAIEAARLARAAKIAREAEEARAAEAARAAKSAQATELPPVTLR